MFCILFGLSMDYEVMLLSRIKEEYERTKDDRASVALGIERTGRLITGAALIMATVFFSFGLAERSIEALEPAVVPARHAAPRSARR